MITYHIMMSYIQKGERIVEVMDFKRGQIIRLTMDELTNPELPEGLGEYLSSIHNDIQEGKWDVRR